jgi:hypothetical protein
MQLKSDGLQRDGYEKNIDQRKKERYNLDSAILKRERIKNDREREKGKERKKKIIRLKS